VESTYDLSKLPLFSKTLMLAAEYDPVPIDPRAGELLIAALEGVASREQQVGVERDSVRPSRWVTITVNGRRCTLNIEHVDAVWNLRTHAQEAMRFIQAHLAPAAPGVDPTERLLKLDLAATNGMLLVLDGRSALLDGETRRPVRTGLALAQSRATVDAGAIRPSGSADVSGVVAPPLLSVESRRAPTGQVVGYVRIGGFGPGVSAELERGLAGLEVARVKGLVLDLRDNRGGLLDEAIKVADTFIKEGTLGSMVGRERGQEQRKEFLAHNSGHEPEGPLVVLVNKVTASGAELVASAIKNLGRGIILGEPTAGAASVRVMFDIPKGPVRSAPHTPRDPSRDVVQDIIDGKSAAPPSPQPPVQPEPAEERLCLLLMTGTLLASGGAPIEGVGLAPDVQPHCVVREQASDGDDCLLRIAQEAIVRTRDSQRSTLLAAAKAIAGAAKSPAAAP
jgi:hypothetical protein